jgi:hypothetical protein
MANLTGQFTNAAGDPSEGYVRLEPTASDDGTLLRASALDPGDGNVVGIDKVFIPLDDDGSFEQEVEPGPYNLVVALKRARVLRGAITVPDMDGDVTLSSLL